MTEDIEQRSAAPSAPAADGAAAADGSEQQDLATLESQLQDARREATESQDRYLRARADMENYKKRIERTYADLSRSSKKNLLAKLLAVRDNLERALEFGNSAATGEGILEGVRLTQYQLDQLLEQEGVRPIEAEGTTFDPRIEEAVHSVHDQNVPDQAVVQVVRRGYTYSGPDHEDEVLRPAQVVVNVHE